MVRVEHVLESWKAVRKDTAQAVEDMPPEQAGFKAAPETGSFSEIARHILDAGHVFTGMLLDGIDDFTAGFRDRIPAYVHPLAKGADPAALAAALRAALDERAEALRNRPPEWWTAMVTRMDSQRITRLEMLQWAKEHELEHRSQLFLCLRIQGVVPPTTRRRQTRR